MRPGPAVSTNAGCCTTPPCIMSPSGSKSSTYQDNSDSAGNSACSSLSCSEDGSLVVPLKGRKDNTCSSFELDMGDGQLAGGIDADKQQAECKPLLNKEEQQQGPGTYTPVTSWGHVKGFLSFFGTGLLAVVAYLDPGNLEAGIQLGVASGMSLLWWTAICCLVFGFVFQCLSGQIGIITGKDLAELLGGRYPKHARIAMWLIIETAIIGADIQETVGSALALSLLTGGRLPLYAGCILVSVSAFSLLLLERVGFRQLEALFGVFIALEGMCMGINFFQADIPAKQVLKGTFIPQLSRQTVPVAVASLGALVMPYNVFFQSSVVNARPRDTSSAGAKRSLLHYLRLENFLVLLMAYVINMFVICVFADGFYGVLTEDEVGLESAGEHLGERFGGMFRTVWAVGLLASGQVATIGLTYAGQLVMSGLLGMKVQAGPRMLFTRLVALVPTVTLAVIFEASHTFDMVAQTLNVVQSIVLPFALVPVLHVAADKKLLGEFASHPAVIAFGGIIAATVAAVNGYLLIDYMRTDFPHTTVVVTAFAVFMAIYYLGVLYYAVGPERVPKLWQRAGENLKHATSWLRAHAARADFPALLEVHH